MFDEDEEVIGEEETGASGTDIATIDVALAVDGPGFIEYSVRSYRDPNNRERGVRGVGGGGTPRSPRVSRIRVANSRRKSRVLAPPKIII